MRIIHPDSDERDQQCQDPTKHADQNVASDQRVGNSSGQEPRPADELVRRMASNEGLDGEVEDDDFRRSCERDRQPPEHGIVAKRGEHALAHEKLTDDNQHQQCQPEAGQRHSHPRVRSGCAARQ
jgi:hypothetical protein